MDLTVNGQRVFAATGGMAFDPTLPVVVFIHPDPVHLLSLTPRTWGLNHLISDVTCANLPVSYIVLTFQCPSLILVLVVFRSP